MNYQSTPLAHAAEPIRDELVDTNNAVSGKATRLQHTITGQAAIAQATGVIMAYYQCTSDSAAGNLQQWSEHTGLHASQLATALTRAASNAFHRGAAVGRVDWLISQLDVLPPGLAPASLERTIDNAIADQNDSAAARAILHQQLNASDSHADRLERSRDDQRLARGSQPSIQYAKGILTMRYGLSLGAAYALLQRLSMNSNLKAHDLADALCQIVADVDVDDTSRAVRWLNGHLDSIKTDSHEHRTSRRATPVTSHTR